MTKLVMTRKSRTHNFQVDTNVCIEPSYRTGSKEGTGVFVQLNAHHIIDGAVDGCGCTVAIDLIDDRFEEVTGEADKIFECVMNMGMQ